MIDESQPPPSRSQPANAPSGSLRRAKSPLEWSGERARPPFLWHNPQLHVPRVPPTVRTPPHPPGRFSVRHHFAIRATV